MPTKPPIIVSFIGHADIGAASRNFEDHPTDPKQQGPGSIMRFLRWKAEQPQEDVGRVYLLDDHPDGMSQPLKAKLEEHLGNLLPNLDIHLVPLRLTGPTSLEELYDLTFEKIKTMPPGPMDLVVSSGTPAMYTTLALAGEHFQYRKPRFFETSMKAPYVRVLKLPYEIGLRPRRGEPRARNAAPRPPGLLPHTAIADPVVTEVYDQLRRLAARPDRVTICLTGEAGSGKHRAARQFAAWQGLSDVVSSSSPEPPAQPPAFLIVARADTIPSSAFPVWKDWLAGHSDVQVVFLCRYPECTQALDKAGLVSGGQYALPAWRDRSDQLELVKAMLAEAGLPITKVDERFKYELLRYPTVQNLHGLRTWLATLAATSKTPNISEAAVESVRKTRELHNNRRLLRRLLGRGSFPQAWTDAGVTLLEIEQAVRWLLLDSLKASYLTNFAVGEQLGIHENTVSDSLRDYKTAIDSIRSKLAAKGVDWIG